MPVRSIHRHICPPLTVAAIAIAILAAVPITAQAQGVVGDTPATGSSRLERMEREWNEIRQESQNLGDSPSPRTAINNTKTRMNELDDQIRRLENTAKELGASTQDLDTLRKEVGDTSVFGLEDIPQEGAEQAIEKGLARVCSKAAGRALGWVFLVGDVVEYGGKFVIRELNEDAIRDMVRSERLKLSNLYELISVLRCDMAAERADLKRLEELRARERVLFGEIARERQRIAERSKTAKDRAQLDRFTDPAGDEEEKRLYLEQGIRLSNPSAAPRRRTGVRLAQPAGNAPGSPIGYAPRCDGYGSGFFYIPGTETCLRIGGYARATSTFVGDDAGIGTIVLGAGLEPFLARADDRLTIPWVGFQVGVDTGAWLHEIDLGYGWGKDDWSGEEPIGGDPVGYTFGMDMFGSTGIGLGGTGARAEGDLDLRMLDVEYRALHAFDLTNGFAPDPSDIERRSEKAFGIIATYGYYSLDHSGMFQSLSFPANMEASVEQDFTSHSFGIGPAVRGTHYLGSGLFIEGGADLQLVYRRSELDSLEQVWCDICGGLPDAFDIEIDEKEENFSLKAGFDAAIGYRLTEGLSIKLGGSVDIGRRDTIDVRENPDDANTGIGQETAVDWSGMLSVQYRF